MVRLILITLEDSIHANTLSYGSGINYHLSGSELTIRKEHHCAYTHFSKHVYLQQKCFNMQVLTK
jgi:hypothetical protein